MIPVCVLIQVSCPFANFLSSPMGPPLAESREHPIYEFVRAAFVSKLCVPVCVARKPGTCTVDFIFSFGHSWDGERFSLVLFELF